MVGTLILRRLPRTCKWIPNEGIAGESQAGMQGGLEYGVRACGSGDLLLFRISESLSG